MAKKTNTLTYHKGIIQAVVINPKLYSAFFYSKFWTQKERSSNKFFCILNNTALKYLQSQWQKIIENFEIDSDIRTIISGYNKIHYFKKKLIVHPIAELEGITYMEHQRYTLSLMFENDLMWFILGQGTGKTYIQAGYVKSIFKFEPELPIVIVTKKTVLPQFLKDIQPFLLDANIIVHQSGKLYTEKQNTLRTLILTNYEQIENLPIQNYHTILYDESQYLNGFNSDVNKAATKINLMAKYKYFFTGTPQDRSRYELLSQIKTALPWIAPTQSSVIERYFFVDDHNKVHGEKRRDELTEIIDTLTYGETTENLLQDELPLIKNYLIECRFKNKTIYNEMTEHHVVAFDKETKKHRPLPNFDTMEKEVLAKWLSEVILIEALNDAAVRSKQRQICNGFIFYPDENGEKQIIWLDEVPKEQEFKNLIEELDNGLIFTQFIPDINIVCKMLKEKGKNFEAITQGMTKTQSNLLIKAFQDGEVDFLVIHNKTGGIGLHVVNTNNTIFYALPESNLLYTQALYRTRRKGQKADTCFVYSFIVKGSVEKQRLVPSLRMKEMGSQIEFEIYRRRN